MKYTPEDYFDRENLVLALEKSEEICSQVNEGVRSQENSNRLEWLQEHVNLEGLEEVLNLFLLFLNNLHKILILSYEKMSRSRYFMAFFDRNLNGLSRCCALEENWGKRQAERLLLIDKQLL